VASTVTRHDTVMLWSNVACRHVSAMLSNKRRLIPKLHGSGGLVGSQVARQGPPMVPGEGGHVGRGANRSR
jgi:hypothetical protein